MPLTKPEKKETKKTFLPRCMSDETMKKEFADLKQRYAVCLNQWKNKNAKK